MELNLTMTCGPYDRSRALVEGLVKPEGINLNISVSDDDVQRNLKAERGEFDIAEFFMGRYIVDLPFKTLGVTAIPIFVKRMFRHSYIYINTEKGIRTPKDLNGRRIGIQSWFTTTALWVRGILEEEHEVDLKSITWVTGRQSENPNEWERPEWLKLEVVTGYEELQKRLAQGDLDAVITTDVLAPRGRPVIDFLFTDYPEREREYYGRTGFFPIQHTLVIKTSVLESYPWVAKSLFDAWQKSKEHCYDWLEWQRVHQTGLWYRALWEEENALAGRDLYHWGFTKNRAEVSKLLHYAHAQGLTTKRHSPEEMFHVSTLDT